MRVEAKIQKWGNGLALRIAGVMRDIPHFQEGTSVAVEITEKGLSITKINTPKKVKFPYKESELLDALSDKNSLQDLITKPLDSEF